MPQKGGHIEHVHRLEGLMAIAEQPRDWDELEQLKERLRKLLEKIG